MVWYGTEAGHYTDTAGDWVDTVYTYRYDEAAGGMTYQVRQLEQPGSAARWWRCFCCYGLVKVHVRILPCTGPACEGGRQLRMWAPAQVGTRYVAQHMI